MNQNQGKIYSSEQDRIAQISFFHPASNSFPSVLLDELAEKIQSYNDREDISLLILKSEGEKAFCAGASFDELLSITDIENGTFFFSGFAKVINAMRTSKKLIIGRIHGKAVGGGVGLAAACDYTFATKTAFIKLSELAIGIGPFVIEPAVTRKIGFPAMSELTLDAESWKSAEWAKENKLYTQLFDNTALMDVALEAFTKKLSGYHPEALYEMKKVLWKGTEHWETLLKERAKISGTLVLSTFTKNALNQFKTK